VVTNNHDAYLGFSGCDYLADVAEKDYLGHDHVLCVCCVAEGRSGCVAVDCGFFAVERFGSGSVNDNDYDYALVMLIDVLVYAVVDQSPMQSVAHNSAISNAPQKQNDCVSASFWLLLGISSSRFGYDL